MKRPLVLTTAVLTGALLVAVLLIAPTSAQGSAAPVLQIGYDEAGPHLTWSSTSQFPGGYELWRGSEPYLQGQSPATRLFYGSSTSHLDSRPPAGSVYYLVIGIDSSGNRHLSNRVGLFHYNLSMETASIVVDHSSVDLFEQIPEQYLDAAAALDMLFIDRSVGANIDDGLSCLSYPSAEEAPNHCVRYEHVDPAYSVDPAVVSWSHPGGYDRSRWAFQFWDDGCNSWSDKLDCFLGTANSVINQYDVLSFQYSYLLVDNDSDIATQPGGYFWDNADRSDVYDQEVFEAQHPDKVFIYWTTSLARGIGTGVSEEFNQQMRDYAIANDKPLFDVADILSHTPNGQPCYDNRDGVPYDNGNNSENYPDDGQDILAICQQYTTETDGGHLGSVSAGKIRVAKAFWVLMAQIAGWNP